jgi:tetratricopeptide (TPR) repeat protein
MQRLPSGSSRWFGWTDVIRPLGTRFLDPRYTAAVVFGAHDWTSAGMGRAPSFLRSAKGVVAYLIDSAGLGLDPTVVLDLFDDTASAGDQLARIMDTLDALLRERRREARPVADLLVYYVGHGHTDDQGHLSLLVRRSRRGVEAETGIKAPDLARVLKVAAPQQRRVVILDCCFSEAAARGFIGQTGAFNQAVAATAVKDLRDDQPRRGSLLLCSSPVGEVSVGPPNAEHTLFTGAMLDVLSQGVEGKPLALSLADLCDATYDRMIVNFGANAPRPVLHQVNAAHGDLTRTPAFPNRAVNLLAAPLAAESAAPTPNFQRLKRRRMFAAFFGIITIAMGGAILEGFNLPSPFSVVDKFFARIKQNTSSVSAPKTAVIEGQDRIRPTVLTEPERETPPLRATSPVSEALKDAPAPPVLSEAAITRALTRLPSQPPQGRAEPPAGETVAAADPAINNLDQMIAANPNDAAALSRRGQLFVLRGNFAFAIRDFNEVLRIRPKDAEAFNNRCWARAIFGDLQSALRDCNEALSIRPSYADALDSRGFVNLKLGQPNGAIADYDAALRTNPKQASSLYGRGMAKLRTGRAADGQRDIAAAKALQANIADEFATLGIR